ncbi:MAG: flagellar biosynthesis anti-sigma factor FlgM [Gemmatimonadetes bacterium]|nr:flagellar biosynthesis anti-sigma factor FlgM [Gemmatimonadota bacterium]MBI3568291.1 flagellar biosynthesis anti-sigma factor FlgM [Gemmatimonadota bacterium]
MKINPTPFDGASKVSHVRPEAGAPVQGTQVPAAPAQPRAPRRDSVELSAEGRALSKGGALTPERTTLIRQRILQGAYDSSAVVDRVAQNILKSGDL